MCARIEGVIRERKFMVSVSYRLTRASHLVLQLVGVLELQTFRT